MRRRVFLGRLGTLGAALIPGSRTWTRDQVGSDASDARHVSSVNAAWFGAIGDGQTDDTRAIQAAIDHALYAGIPLVTLPHGRFRTTDTLHLGYGEEFRTIVLEGAGEFSYRGATAGSTLVPENTRKPAVNIQGGRGSAIRNISILGRNYDFVREQTLHPNASGESDPQRWIDAAIKKGLSRFSPYAAVTIDAFSGRERIDDDYGDAPNVPYTRQEPNRYPRRFSSDVIIDRCWIGGFGVAIAVQPCDADGNGDFVRVTNCCIENCVYGIAVGNSQSRNVAVRDSVYARLHTFVTNKAVGRGVGTLGGVFDNVSGINSFQFMDVIASYSLSVTVTSLYCESQSRIGTWSNNSQLNHSIVFQSCNFYLAEGLTGVAANTLLDCGALGSVRFVGCAFHHARRIYNVVRGASQVTLEDCLIGPVDDFRGNRFFEGVPNYLARALEYTAGGAFVHSDAMGARVRFVGNLGLSFSSGTGKVSLRSSGEILASKPGERVRVHHYAKTFLDRYGVTWRIRYKREPFALRKRVDDGVLKSITRVSGDLIELVLLPGVQTNPDSRTEPGDIVYDALRGTIFVISAVELEASGCRIFAQQMNDFRVIDGKVVPNEPDVSSDGYLWFYRCNTMIGDAVFFGDFTAGKDIVRDVRCGNGDSRGLELAIEAGEFLYESRARTGVSITPYPTMTRVAAVDPLAAEVRLDRPARSTGRHLVSTVCLD